VSVGGRFRDGAYAGFTASRRFRCAIAWCVGLDRVGITERHPCDRHANADANAGSDSDARSNTDSDCDLPRDANAADRAAFCYRCTDCCA